MFSPMNVPSREVASAGTASHSASSLQPLPLTDFESTLEPGPGVILSRRKFLARIGIGAAGMWLVAMHPRYMEGAQMTRDHLPRSTPEAQGMSSQAILAFLEAVDRSKHEFHSLMVVRHGKVIAEGWWSPYRAGSPHMLYSLSKSFTSTAVGLAVAEGKLTVKDRVITFFPKDLPAAISDHLADLRVKDLLTMSVGHGEDSTASLWDQDNWVKQFLSLPIPNPPGTQFLYNSGATFMLSAIVQKVSGVKLLDFLEARLFQPLGISGATWETAPQGINTGGWGLKLQTEALAKFGLLYLQQGKWDDRQLLPASWIAEATSFKIQQPGGDLERLKQQSDWHQGYCYQFWRCRHNAYRGDGAFGQYCIVMPDQDAVIAITSESPSMQGELDLIWEHLLPAMKTEAIAADQSSQSQLAKRLGSLALQPPKALKSSAAAARVSRREFVLEPNDAGIRSVGFAFKRDSCMFTATNAGGSHTIHCGLASWILGRTSMPGTPPKLTKGKLGPVSQIAASGTWKDEITFEMTWRFYETPHHDTVTCRFEGDQLTVEFLDSMTAMAPGKKDQRNPWRGRLKA